MAEPGEGKQTDLYIGGNSKNLTKEQKIQRFMQTGNISEAAANKVLDVYKWDLQKAVEYYLRNPDKFNKLRPPDTQRSKTVPAITLEKTCNCAPQDNISEEELASLKKTENKAENAACCMFLGSLGI